jgi:hypothetical protein
MDVYIVVIDDMHREFNSLAEAEDYADKMHKENVCGYIIYRATKVVELWSGVYAK